MAACRVPYRGVPCLASQSFSGGHQLLAEVRRVLCCARASEGRCIPRGSRLQERAHWALVRHFHLRERHGLAAVRVALRDGPVNAMFRVA